MKKMTAVAGLIGLATVAPLSAQTTTDFPSRPIRIIVPLAPGGAVDTIARSMNATLSSRLGQPVIVENRPGAGETIGIELTARATPDGHTVLMSSAAVVTNPVLSTVRYHPIKDFTPITQITRQPYILIVHPSVPANTARDLIAWGKAHPGKLNFASAGSGSLMHLTGELFKANAGVAMTHVPYKGMALAYPDLIAGQVQVGFPTIITALPHLKSGKVRGLGVTSKTRVASLPDIPSIQESGLPGFTVEQWYGVWAPAGTPAPVAARLHKEFATVVREPDTVARLTASGSEAVGSSSAEFAAHVKAESERWAKIVSQAGIKIQ